MSKAQRLIEREARKHYTEDEVGVTEHKYRCLDTGACFETHEDPALYSPYTGTTNIEFVTIEDDIVNDDYYDDEMDVDDVSDVDYEDEGNGVSSHSAYSDTW